MNIFVLVVLYNKEPIDSASLRSLIGNEFSLNIVVFNNGPKLINSNDDIFSELKKNHSITILQDLNNLPLSKIYNQFIYSSFIRGGEFFCIFDDDSKIPVDYFNSLSLSVDVYLPIIKNYNSDIFYPSVNHQTIKLEQSILLGDIVYSIGSGLMINKSVVGVFNSFSISLFDERFSLYGVDFSFFRRVEMVNKKENHKLIKFEAKSFLIHELSYDVEGYSFFRKYERDIDYILSLKHYVDKNVFLKYLLVFKFIIKNILFSKEGLITRVFKYPQLLLIYIQGCHPKCR